MFYREGLLAPHPTDKLEDYPLSAVQDCLFNLFAATIHIGGRSSIRNLRKRHAVVTGTHYTWGDTIILVEKKDDMNELIKLVKNSSHRVGLNLNLLKSTVMSTVEKVNIFSDGEDSSTGINYKFLVILITSHSYTNEETKEKNKFEQTNNGKFDKSHKVLEASTNTKVKLL